MPTPVRDSKSRSVITRDLDLYSVLDSCVLKFLQTSYDTKAMTETDFEAFSKEFLNYFEEDESDHAVVAFAKKMLKFKEYEGLLLDFCFLIVSNPNYIYSEARNKAFLTHYRKDPASAIAFILNELEILMSPTDVQAQAKENAL